MRLEVTALRNMRRYSTTETHDIEIADGISYFQLQPIVHAYTYIQVQLWKPEKVNEAWYQANVVLNVDDRPVGRKLPMLFYAHPSEFGVTVFFYPGWPEIREGSRSYDWRPENTEDVVYGLVVRTLLP